jgi:hypothetical protein
MSPGASIFEAGDPQPPSRPAALYDFVFSERYLGFEPPLPVLLFCVAPPLVYLFLLFVIFPAMTPRTREAVLECDRWRYRHNVALMLFSLVSFALSVYEVVSSGDWRFLLSPLRLESWKGLACRPASPMMVAVNALFIASKAWEWLDSGFLVWLKNVHARGIINDERNRRKLLSGAAGAVGSPTSTAAAGSSPAVASPSSPSKDLTGSGAAGDHGVTFLHAYHHCTTILAFLVVTSLPGAVKVGPLVNGFVHTLMYAHYAHPFPKPFVPLITAMQITQFVYVITLWLLAPHVCPSFAAFRARFPLEYVAPFLFTPVYLVFFLRYFVNRFVLGLRDKGE